MIANRYRESITNVKNGTIGKIRGIVKAVDMKSDNGDFSVITIIKKTIR